MPYRKLCRWASVLRMPTPADSSPMQQPLRLLKAEDVKARFAAALIEARGPEAAHCIHELWMRGEMAVHIERMLEQIWKACRESVPEWLPMRHIEWLPVAYEVSAKFRARRGKSNIYLVLLDYRDSRSDPYGVYVGMTQYSANERFDQHKAGIRASGSVLKRGLEVLTGPVLHLQEMPRAQAEEIEEGLAEALRAEGLLVRGGH